MFVLLFCSWPTSCSRSTWENKLAYASKYGRTPSTIATRLDCSCLCCYQMYLCDELRFPFPAAYLALIHDCRCPNRKTFHPPLSRLVSQKPRQSIWVSLLVPGSRFNPQLLYRSCYAMLHHARALCPALHSSCRLSRCHGTSLARSLLLQSLIVCTLCVGPVKTAAPPPLAHRHSLPAMKHLQMQPSRLQCRQNRQQRRRGSTQLSKSGSRYAYSLHVGT